ncbi:hypothetical protein FF38_11494 [Lucilia cuprina]|uniref:Uncharacterized protein n=1 Tax=Lucilia cuprina TaxID=7375 RepID=A0A0L0CBG3_LUCCU|nr:hypothetical protein CVS40_2884 [Lucilia cuprina]KNC29572.1 hypothetical protein FF38_11494 [Lucilia cuprina]
MLLIKRTPYTFLIICAIIIRQSYQQNVPSIKTKNKQLRFCIQNHTMSNTLQTFWHDANNADCQLDSKSLIQLYGQFMVRSAIEEDQCSTLLKHQIRKKIINLISSQLEEALIAKALHNDEELKQDLKLLQKIDKRVNKKIWETVLNEVYLFVELKDIIHEIVQLNEEVELIALQSLLNKVTLEPQQMETLLPLLTFHIISLNKKRTSTVATDKLYDHLYRRLPPVLRLLYESSKQPLGLLNYQHHEFLYAPRDNGPDNERRLALTWTETKNSTDSDGHLLVTFNDQGLVAFGNRYGSAIKYLYADVEHQAAYFWIGTGLKSDQWWEIIWPHQSVLSESADYIIIQNENTKELLCATLPYDENRRYVTLLSAKKNIENPACYWLISRF